MGLSKGAGDIIGGRYRLESIVGEGGMAVVWKAVHTETDRTVALKLIRAEVASSDQVREMFVREAKIAARIGAHPNIVDVLDAGIDSELAVPFIAMELLAGRSIEERIRKEGPIPYAQVLSILRDLADALDEAHAAKVIHRDLKPQNLFLTKSKRQGEMVKILDFGIAKLVDASKPSSTTVGTPAYSAPEQLGPSWVDLAATRGKTIAREVSPQTDVWAIGLSIYEMLIGANAGAIWGATTLAELPVKMVLEDPPIASARAAERACLLPPGFDGWLVRALALDATQRFESAGAMFAAFEALGAPSSDASRRSDVPIRPSRSESSSHIAVGTSQVYEVEPVSPTVSDGFGPEPPAAYGAAPYAAMSSAPMATLARPYPDGGTSAVYPHGAGGPQPHPGSMGQPYFGGTPQTPAPGANDFGAWLHHRRAEWIPSPDQRAFVPWGPVFGLGPVYMIHREVRVPLPDVNVSLFELSVDDPVRRATGEARVVVAVARGPRPRYRVAFRSRASAGLAVNVQKGLKFLDSLSGSVRRSIGDPVFEGRFELEFPSPEEGYAALSMPLRGHLVNGQIRGAFETRPQSLVAYFEDHQRFDPMGCERTLQATLAFYHLL